MIKYYIIKSDYLLAPFTCKGGKMNKRFGKILSAVGIFMACIALTGCFLFAFDRGDIKDLPNSNQVSVDVSFGQTQTADRVLYTDYAEVANKVMRSVVAIRMDYSVGGVAGTAYGSGVIVEIDNEKYIITCHHVISSGGNVTVYIPDENARNIGDSDYNLNYALTGRIEADRIGNALNGITLVGGDKDADIAVLKLNLGLKQLNIVSAPVPIESYSVKYAEKIFTIGNPSGLLPMTFMDGYISYIDREVSISGVGEMTLLQHNSSITHGSSGGAMFNMYGELIGITNGGSDEYYNQNYAIPYYGTNGFLNIAKQLIGAYNSVNRNFGYVTGRWALGITITTAETVVHGSNVVIAAVDALGNCYEKLYANDRILSVTFNKDGKTQTIETGTATKFASAMSELKKAISLDVDNPQSFFIKIYRPNLGEKTVEIKIEKQLIFCDTGIYN